jgi:hypothetical protein
MIRLAVSYALRDHTKRRNNFEVLTSNFQLLKTCSKQELTNDGFGLTNGKKV